MSITKRIAFGAGASWFSRGLTIILGLLLMPVLFRKLGQEELGVWMLLGQTWILLGIFDFGLSLTLTRRVALARGKSGSDPATKLTEESKKEIADLVESGKRIYKWLSVGVFLSTFFMGALYLQHLHLTTLDVKVAWLAWGILCLCQAFGVWATVWSNLLQGMGYVGWDALLSSIIGALVLLAQIIAVAAGGGLVALATLAALGSLTQRFLMLHFARGRMPDLFSTRGSWNTAAVRSMVPAALRCWITSCGIVMVMNSDQYFISGLHSVSELPSYRAAYIVFFNLRILGVSVATASAVFVSHLWQSGHIGEVHRVVFRNLRFGLGIMAAGGACVLVLGSRLFNVWIGHNNFIGYPCLILFFCLLISDAHCCILSESSRATEDEAFAFCSAAGGVIKLVLAYLLGSKYGLIGIAAATLIAQLCTNHWYMVARALFRLRISLRDHLQRVVLPVAALFVATLLTTHLILQAGMFAKGWPAIIASSFLSGLLLLAFSWQFVLEHGQRHRLLTWAKLRLQPTAPSE